MSMRLLSKNDILTEKAVERKREIDEGIKLTRRVSALREQTAQEESNRSTLAAQSQRVLSEKIKPLVQQFDALTAEVTSLEERKKQALIPLDTAWIEVQEAKEKVRLLESEYSEKLGRLSEKSQEIDARERAVEISERHLASEKDTIRNTTAKANNLLTSAQSESARTTENANRIHEEVAIRAKEIAKQEEFLESRRLELSSYQIYLEKKEKDLIAAERLLRDREQTLLRSINRK